MKVGVIGMGNMGTAIANIIAKNGYEVIGWEYFEKIVEEINSQHKNSQFLPDIELHSNLRATTDLKEVFSDSSVVFVALPSVFIKKVLGEAGKWVKEDVAIVNLSKGVERETCFTASRILKEIFPGREIVVLSGPSIANEFSKGFPCGVVLAGSNKEILYQVARLVETDTFRARFSNDVIGVEWSGILKNIYAIGLGLIDGAGIESVNFKAAFITRAIEEVADLVEALGGSRRTVYYLAGLGDLIATSLSEHSHNRKLGELLSQGYSFEQAQKEMRVLPEGVKTLKIAVYLSEKYHTPMPVARGILSVIEGKLSPIFLVEKFMQIGV